MTTRATIAGKRLLFVGLNTIDLMYLVPRYPDPNTKNKAARHQIAVGGPAANAAVAAAFLGAPAVLLSPIGAHSLTGYILDELGRHGVTVVDPLAGRAGVPTFASIITSSENGERTVFSYHPEDRVAFEPGMHPSYEDIGLALFDSFHLDLAVPLAARCRERGVTTVLDGGSWKAGLDRLLPYIDIAICSSDFRAGDAETAADLFEYLRGCGVAQAAITRGERPILFSDNARTGEIPVPRINPVDTLGAGDIFHGAFTAFYAAGRCFEAALERAGEVAAASCASFGTRAWMTGPVPWI